MNYVPPCVQEFAKKKMFVAHVMATIQENDYNTEQLIVLIQVVVRQDRMVLVKTTENNALKTPHPRGYFFHCHYEP